MTTSAGHLDFQDYASWRSNLLAHGIGAAVTLGNPITKILNSSNYAGMILQINTVTGNNMTVSMAQFGNLPPAQSMDVETFVIAPGQQCVLFVPFIGSSVNLTFSTAQAGGTTFTYNVVGTNVQLPEVTSVRVSQAIRRNGVVVAASGVDANLYPSTIEGNGYLFYSPADGAGELAITVTELSEAAANQGTIYSATMPAVANQPTIVQFKSTLNPVKVTVQNNDAAVGHAYTMFLKIGNQ